MRVDEKQLQITELDTELQELKRRNSDGVKKVDKKEAVSIVDQYKERAFIVKVLAFLSAFVVVVFMVIFAIQLFKIGSVDKTLEVFKALAAIASPVVTLVLGYYFGSKTSKK